MQLNPSEISELIKSRIQNLDTGAQMRTQGTVVSVTDASAASRPLGRDAGRNVGVFQRTPSGWRSTSSVTRWAR